MQKGRMDGLRQTDVGMTLRNFLHSIITNMCRYLLFSRYQKIYLLFT